MFKELNPKHWRRPKGYNNAIMADGTLIFIAGQIGWDKDEKFHSDDFVDQLDQTLANIVDVLKEAGAVPGHLVRLTWYVKDKKEYMDRLSEVGATYRKHLGHHFPAMTMVQITDLAEDRAKLEIEATAVRPYTE